MCTTIMYLKCMKLIEKSLSFTFLSRIRLGEWDVNGDSEFYSHVEFDATQIFIHPDFYPGNLYNDIAMIRINGYVDYTRNPHVTPVCLPDRFRVSLRFRLPKYQ